MTHRVTLIPGDGIGPEVIEAARRTTEGTGVSIDRDRQDVGAGAFGRTGDALPLATLDSIRSTRVALKGPIETPATSGLRSANLSLRQELDPYANVARAGCIGGSPPPTTRSTSWWFARTPRACTRALNSRWGRSRSRS